MIHLTVEGDTKEVLAAIEAKDPAFAETLRKHRVKSVEGVEIGKDGFAVRRVVINSEGEAFVDGQLVEDWKPSTAAESRASEAWESAASIFRNFSTSGFLETCWMPSASAEDDESRLTLAAEFGAAGNEMNPREGLPLATDLRARLEALVDAVIVPPSAWIEVVETEPNYFEIQVSSHDEAARQVAADASRLIAADPLLRKAHEFIS